MEITEVDVMRGKVVAVARNDRHQFTKTVCKVIYLFAGLGVEGDAHCGRTVRHRSRVAKNPAAPNLRQVHLIHAELFAELATHGFSVAQGGLGENVTTADIDLLCLSRSTRLRLGKNALIEITGLRNPCRQIDENVGPGAMAATLDRTPDGSLLRKAGVMAVVLESGEVRAGDAVSVVWEPPKPLPLAVV